MGTTMANENGSGTCEVCKRSFKLVGKNPAVLANHGFKVDLYGQSSPCLGAGFVPNDSLAGAIRRTKSGIEFDSKWEDFAWRVEIGKEVLARLETITG